MSPFQRAWMIRPPFSFGFPSDSGMNEHQGHRSPRTSIVPVVESSLTPRPSPGSDPSVVNASIGEAYCPASENARKNARFARSEIGTCGDSGG